MVERPEGNERMIGVYVPEELYEKIKRQAQEKERSVSGHVRFILKELFDKKEEKDGE